MTVPAHRPLIHFTPPHGWMNDPNGLVHADGKFHLFYQYYPDATVWGPMHWGHATSDDLLRWTHQPVALRPQGDDFVFSGSAVVDAEGTAGGGAGALVALFTNHDAAAQAAGATGYQTQHLAWSADSGTTWTRHPANPVLRGDGRTSDFRDPKVFWHAPTQRWICVLAAGDRVEFHGSPNLVDWTKLGEFGADIGSHEGVWECPDLFELPVAGAPVATTRWVLLVSVTLGAPGGGSGTQYFVGSFDGRDFVPDPDFAAAVDARGAVWMDQGRDNYAGVTWSGDPAGRRLLIGWMSNWAYARDVPATTWRGAMTLPVQLGLVDAAGGVRLRAWPVQELERLRMRTHEVAAGLLSAPLALVDPAEGHAAAVDIELEFALDPGAVTVVGIELANALGETYRMGFDALAGVYFSDRRNAGGSSFSPVFGDQVHVGRRAQHHATVRLRIVLDVTSAELFADDGEVWMTDTFFPDTPFDSVRLFCEGAPARLVLARWHALAAVGAQP